jgi:putative salt-induced outer membrane protein YdiY
VITPEFCDPVSIKMLTAGVSNQINRVGNSLPTICYEARHPRAIKLRNPLWAKAQADTKNFCPGTRSTGHAVPTLLGCIGVLLLALLPRFAVADEIRMKNGDRFTGEIVRMEKELLIFKADYVEEKLSISWGDVDCISSERNLPTEFKDNEFLIGRISCPESGMVQIESTLLGKSMPMPLNELRSVNPSTYSGIFNLGGSLNSGNTDTRALNVATRFQVRTRKHRFTVDAKHNYGEANGVATARNSSASLKYDFFARDKVYSYAQSLTEQDTFANLNLRNTEGLGMGYQFFDTRQRSLFVEAGVSFFNEDVMVGEDKRNAAGRWAAGIEWEAVPKRLKLFHRQEGYYIFSAKSVVLRMEQGLRVPLIDNVSANFEVDYRFNNHPEAGKRNSDLNVILGLSYVYAYW